MLIKDIFLELRSRLRSCNVYITTAVDFTKSNLKICIQANCIIVNYYSNDDYKKRSDSLSSIESLSDCVSEDDSDVTMTIPIKEFCQIIPNSMSCLKIYKNNISFRILTEPKGGDGNFYKEVLATNPMEQTTKVNKMIVNVKVDKEIQILCSNCSNVISNSVVKFDRVLELPSTNLDMSDWFCHNHGGTSQCTAVKSNKTDFLYRLTYFVVNNCVLSEKSNKFNSKRDIYHCNRCLAWLGVKQNDEDTVKLFNSEVNIKLDELENTAFTYNTAIEDQRTSDFIYTIELIMKEFNLGYQYTVLCKIILECFMSSTQRQYLLIWIMDKELQVLKNKEEILSDNIELQSSFLTKILYKVEDSLNEEVEVWMSDPAVVSTQISKIMFSQGLEHLQKMSLKIPEPFRVTNGYFVSYLKV